MSQRRLPIIFALLLLVVELIWNIVNPDLVVSLLIALVTLVLYIGIREFALYEIMNTHSNVVVDISRCTTLEGIVNDTRGKNKTIKYTVKRYFLPLKQIEKKGVRLADSDAMNAEVNFYDENFVIIKNIANTPAFWYNDKPRAKRSNRQDDEVIIKKSGEVEGVGLIIKEVGIGKPLYAFNQNSYIPGTGDFQFEESMKIRPAVIHTHIHISDGNFSNDYWVRITREYKREHPLFELVDSPK